MRFLLYAALFAFIGMLYIWSHDPATDPAAAHVMTTTFVSLNSGVVVNLVCAVGAFATHAVPRGMESDACMPYSIVAVAVGARLHTFGEGNGFGLEERAYISETPTRVRKLAWEAPWMLWEGMKLLFSKLSLVGRD